MSPVSGSLDLADRRRATPSVLALTIRLALGIRLRGSVEGRGDTRGEDIERGEAMQAFRRGKARHTGPGP